MPTATATADADADEVIYLVTPADDLVTTDGGWDTAALQGGAPDLAGGRALGRSLWDFVTDRPTRALYRDLLARVRAGRAVEFPLRCDTPAARRLLRVRLAPARFGLVEFRARVAWSEPRPPVPLLDPAAPRTDELVTMCGWCKRVAVGPDWVEVEDGVARLELFERAAVPRLSHGICGPCLDRMTELGRAGVD